MSEKIEQETNRLLKVMIGLLARNKQDKIATLRDQIGVLTDLGLAPSDIAEILGRSGNYVNKELSELRKINKNKKG